eukprot:TRINITY_DN13072_c0_g1_i26.p3 TRINITY_DN13072_c0_g1~~TRINITY_DN13072_c0_g1_i26.p3  ORF type:complete len:169 (-),score=77.97 TRINITY_DN13072_c0_g1_i26:912-1418(-)
MDLEEERKFLSSKDRSKRKEVEACIKSICDIIRNIVSDVKLVKYFILLLDGMIEDDKDRLSLLTGLQKGKDKEDIVDLFMRYFVGASNADQGTKDVVANILAKLLTSKDLKGMEDKMKEFLNYLLSMQASDNSAERPITSLGFSVALMHLLKVGEIALYFIKSEGLTT